MLSAVSWILECVICQLNYHLSSSINLSKWKQKKKKRFSSARCRVVNWPNWRAHWRAHHWEGDAGQGGEAHVDLRGLGELLGLVHDGAQSAGAHDAKHDEEGAAETGKVLRGILITIAVNMETNKGLFAFILFPKWVFNIEENICQVQSSFTYAMSELI